MVLSVGLPMSPLPVFEPILVILGGSHGTTHDAHCGIMDAQQ